MINKLFNDLSKAKFEKNYKKTFEILGELKKQVPHMRDFFIGDEVGILKEMGKYEEALSLLNDSLFEFPNNASLLEHKSDIVYHFALKETDINKVRIGVDEAIDILSKLITRRQVEMYQYLSQRKNYTRADHDYRDSVQESIFKLSIRRSDMSNMSKLLTVQNQMIEFKKEIYSEMGNFQNEKIKQFEQLGLFSAIIALIITNVQIIPELSIEKVFVFNISLALVLLFVISGGSLLLEIGRTDSYFKRWKFWFCIAIIMFLYILYLKIS